MFQIGKTLVSEALLTDEFVCNLSACKGACCYEGEAGAPLTDEETKTLTAISSTILPYLRPEGASVIKSQGVFVKGADGDWETPLVQGKECAYATQDAKGTWSCGIEEAYNAGAVTFKKPISCHLYPVRIQDYSEFSAVNYHQWPICHAACTLGQELKVPVYRFVKEALERKFGKQWFLELESVAKTLKKEG